MSPKVGAGRLIVWNDTARLLATFLAGPFTLVLPRKEKARISLLASAGLDTMAVRIPCEHLLKPKVRVIGIVCAAENMPDGKAQKPGDVQTAMSGKTIEIINTDAEGRLVLADGLSYARQLGATT